MNKANGFHKEGNTVTEHGTGKTWSIRNPEFNPIKDIENLLGDVIANKKRAEVFQKNSTDETFKGEENVYIWIEDALEELLDKWKDCKDSSKTESEDK